MYKSIKPHYIFGTFQVPGDKSISHRAVMLGSLAVGTTKIANFLQGEDCLSTLSCFNALGVKHVWAGEKQLHITGVGLQGLQESQDVLNAGNSGTTMRLMSGILAAQPFLSVITGDVSLRSRPMKRVVEPLLTMGANILTRIGGQAPLVIKGSSLKGGSFYLEVASAQLKSALLLAGMFAEGNTIITEPSLSRDHTERMLRYFGAEIISRGATASIIPGKTLTARDINVPGDISSAAFLMAAGIIAGKEKLTIKDVGINPTRTGIIDVLRAMGGVIDYINVREEGGEPVADIEVYPGELHAVEVSGELIPRLIDEIPIIAVVAAFAKGETVIRDAGELRIKESDRLQAITEELGKFGVDITEYPDGIRIKGGKKLLGANINPRKDHRIAMAMAVAALAAEGETIINDAECTDVSYPGFWEAII